jgi:EAL domain-containing protein (putative c-di-GMP-specific phosphodiesterase class I)
MEMLRNAGVALHRARVEASGPRLTYVAGMHAVIADRHSLANDLRGAWLRGEMRVVYQPLVALDPPMVTGVEALARWTHPLRGPIPPDVFIPLAEEHGMISEIDLWVLEQACRAAQAWRAAHRPLRVSVNISGRDLDQAGLAMAVTDTLAATGLPADLLELELTEGVAVRQQEAALSALRLLRELGVSIAIDDFGTGYSMLSRLRDFPLDRIKIDRAFVRDMGDDRRDAPLVAAMIGMGKALALEVVAEGVETAGQLAFLAAQGCDQVQGFLLGHPVECDHVVEAASAATAALELLAAAPTP